MPRYGPARYVGTTRRKHFSARILAIGLFTPMALALLPAVSSQAACFEQVDVNAAQLCARDLGNLVTGPATAVCGGGSCVDAQVCGLGCINYAETYGTIRVLNDGICDLLTVTVDLTIPASVYGVDAPYDEDSTCHVIPRSTVTIASGSGDMAGGTVTESAGLSRSVTIPPVPEPPLVTHSNYVHSSQTLQDVVNIDVAKLKTVTERWWDTVGAWMYDNGNVYDWGQASTSRSWNHPETPVPGSFDWDCTELTTCDQVHTEWAAGYHTDFVWCNASKSSQHFTLRNVVYAKKDGGYSAKYYQKVGCPGLHHATRTWQNNNSAI
jgi:hypothetical protein